MAKALADYRRGRFNAAHEWANRSATVKVLHPHCRAAALFIDALALGQAKQIEAARAAFRAGDAVVRQNRMNFVLDHAFLRDWILADLLCREAETLLNERSRQAN
jgi:hypothetical protein